MTRLVIATAAAAALVAATVTSAAPRALGKRASCGPKTVDIYFFPKGHGAIPRLGFSAYRVPHAEFYKAKDVRGSAFTGFMAPDEGSPARRCKKLVTPKRGSPQAPGRRASARRSAASCPRSLSCASPRSPAAGRASSSRAARRKRTPS